MRVDLYLSFALLFLLQGCLTTTEMSEKQMIQTEQPVKVTTVVSEGVLSIDDAGKEYVLADDALDYRVIQSPDAKWLAVETMLLSDLQIIRVYEKDAQGKYQPIHDSLSVRLWADLSKQEGFDIDDVRHPRMNLLDWVDGDTMSINMSGETDESLIDRNVSFHLE